MEYPRKNLLEKPILRENFLRLCVRGAILLIFGCKRTRNEIVSLDYIAQVISEIRESFEISHSIDNEAWSSAIKKAVKEEWAERVFSNSPNTEKEIEDSDFEENEDLQKKVAVILAIIKKESNFENPAEIKDFQTQPTNPQAETAGVMQVNVSYAQQEGGFGVNIGALKVLSTLEGGIKYGVKYLAKIAEIYKDLEDEELKLKCIFADYNAGAFASRNTAIQKFLNTYADANLKEDGLIGGETKKLLEKFLLNNGITEEQYKKDFKVGALSSVDLVNKASWRKMVEIKGEDLLPVLPETQRRQTLLKRILKGKTEATSKNYAENTFLDYQKILEILENYAN